jgi:ribosome maturation protein SDO1
VKTLDYGVVARYESSGERFEVLVDPDLAKELIEGGDVKLEDVLAVDAIFKDVRKGDRASSESLKKVFETEEFLIIAARVIKEGEIHLTTEQRREMLEQKRKQIVTYITRNAINPRTMTPHPPQRIENAISEAKVQIDPFKSVESQVGDVITGISPLLPIKIDSLTVAIKLPAEDAARVYGDIREYGAVQREEWQKDGSWVGLVKIPAGVQDEFFDRLNSRTKGSVETKIIR